MGIMLFNFMEVGLGYFWVYCEGFLLFLFLGYWIKLWNSFYVFCTLVFCREVLILYMGWVCVYVYV